MIAFGHLEDPIEKRSTTGGRPFRGMEAKIVDPDTGVELPPNTPGAVLLRGVGLFEGYYKDPEQTAKAMEGGWLNTGDLGIIDEDGRVAYRGRFKDMLKVGGENVSALEIEAYLGTHPKVKVVAVASVPDEKYTEVPAAFVEIVPGESLTEDELIAYCKDQIANFKIPRYVRFIRKIVTDASELVRIP